MSICDEFFSFAAIITIVSSANPTINDVHCFSSEISHNSCSSYFEIKIALISFLHELLRHHSSSFSNLMLVLGL